jgi:uncharacterized membrane protein YcaP (DUF421 family)
MDNNLNFVYIIVCTSAIYIFITVAIRVFGKKELSQLSVSDLVFVLLISNAVQNAMVNSDFKSLWGGLIAATTLFILNYIFKYLTFRLPKLFRLLEGEPVILVTEGKVIDNNLKKLTITFNELLEAIREHGVADIREVNLAVFEVDGNISILTDNYGKRTVKSINHGKKRNKTGIFLHSEKNVT